MSAAMGTEVSLLEPFQTVWTILRAHQSNVLLEGPRAGTDAMLRRLQPHIREPSVWNETHVLVPPSGQIRSLIPRGVAALSAADRTRLLAWTEGSVRARKAFRRRSARCCARRAARFDEALYYRRNVMRIRVGSQFDPPR